MALTRINMKSSDMPTGSVLQVIQSKSSTAFNVAAANTWEDTGYTVTITPTSNNNDVMITFSGWGILLDPQHTAIKLVRGTTDVYQTECYVADGSYWSQGNYGFTFLDSPATTSATTYKIQARCSQRTADQEFRMNYASTIPGTGEMTMIAQEIAR